MKYIDQIARTVKYFSWPAISSRLIVCETRSFEWPKNSAVENSTTVARLSGKNRIIEADDSVTTVKQTKNIDRQNSF